MWHLSYLCHVALPVKEFAFPFWTLPFSVVSKCFPTSFLLTWLLADTSEVLNPPFSSGSLLKGLGKIRGKECKTECEGVRRGEGSQSPWGLSFSSPHLTPSLSSPLLVWKHNHSLWVSVHILTIFWWGQGAERVKRVKRVLGWCRRKARKQHNLDVC